MNIKVYVKTNENNEIIHIASSIFLKYTNGYIEIDSGQGDKFSHAQNKYLPKGLIDEQGRYNYKLIDGEVVEVAEEEKHALETVEQITIEDRVEVLENALLEMILGGTE